MVIDRDFLRMQATLGVKNRRAGGNGIKLQKNVVTKLYKKTSYR